MASANLNTFLRLGWVAGNWPNLGLYVPEWGIQWAKLIIIVPNGYLEGRIYPFLQVVKKRSLTPVLSFLEILNEEPTLELTPLP